MKIIPERHRRKNQNRQILAVDNHFLCEEGIESYWDAARNRLLESVEEEQLDQVKVALCTPHVGGRGLRLWLQMIAIKNKHLPKSLPWKLMQVYLDEPDALPLHECSGCGVAIPVRLVCPVVDEERIETFFPACPCCGSRTGLYATWDHPPQTAGYNCQGPSLPGSNP